jgi:hypothetical protein
MQETRRQPTAAAPGNEEAPAQTPARASTRGVARPELTAPLVVPMTPQQHDQAVAALTTMIYDWLCARQPAAATEKPRDPSHHHPKPADR